MKIVILALVGLGTFLCAVAQPVLPSTGDHGSDTNASDHAFLGHAPDDSHLLEAGDQISFQIMEDKKPATNLVVTDSGEVHAPYIGRVEAAGKTCGKLAEELKTMLEKDYYIHATVVIGLETVSKVDSKMNKVIGRVLIWGKVRNPGAVDIQSGHKLTVSEAILRAGGLMDEADKKNLKIIRKDARGSPHTIPVNLHDIMDKGKTEKDIVVEPNDYIIVETRVIRF